MLLYRKYLHLSKQEKSDFDKYKHRYSPREWRGAFIIMKHLKIPFHHSLFRKVYRLYHIPSLEFFKRYRTKVISSSNKVTLEGKPTPYIKPKYLIKEILFRGYVPIENYKPKLGYSYDYIIIQDKCYILPIKFSYGYISKRNNKGMPRKGQINVDDSRYGIPGYGSLTMNDIQVKNLISYYNNAIR
nr:MAG TPA: hypothetical protein [Caudoviricetes sp.]